MQAVGLAAFGGGAALQYWSTIEEGKEANRQSKLEQRRLNQQADLELEAGRVESREKRKEARRVKASQIAQIAASGGLLTGSKLEILADTAFEFESDARTIMRNFQVRAGGLRFEGALARYRGQLARRSARIRAATGLMKNIGGALLLSSLASPTSPGVTQAPGSSFVTPAGGGSTTSVAHLLGR